MADLLALSGAFDLRDRAYLDGANQGPMPRAALEAVRTALEWKRDPSGLDDRLYFDLPERVRVSAAKLLRCRPDDVALATGASHGIGLVASGLDWRAGDRVLIPAGEFPANALPWLALRPRGVRVEVVDPERLLESISADVRVVAVGHVNFSSGRRLDLRAIGERCADCGVLWVADVSQSLGALPVDVTEWGADVVACAGYKWLLSPYGTGLTYVRPDRVDELPVPALNWSTIRGAEDFNRLVDLEPEFRPGARRFDVPETAAFLNVSAMAESLELLVEVGPERAFRHSASLLDRLIDGLPARFDVESDLAADRRSSILRLTAADDEPTDRIHAALRAAGVSLSLREGGLRVAPGIWCESRDIDRTLEVLHDSGH